MVELDGQRKTPLIQFTTTRTRHDNDSGSSDSDSSDSGIGTAFTRISSPSILACGRAAATPRPLHQEAVHDEVHRQKARQLDSGHLEIPGLGVELAQRSTVRNSASRRRPPGCVRRTRRCRCRPCRPSARRGSCQSERHGSAVGYRLNRAPRAPRFREWRPRPPPAEWNSALPESPRRRSRPRSSILSAETRVGQ